MSLSDKVWDCRAINTHGGVKWFCEEDVKEFIKELKEELMTNVLETKIGGTPLMLKCVKTMDREIDKLAGSELTEDKND